jgi:chromate transport protein ChrA
MLSSQYEVKWKRYIVFSKINNDVMNQLYSGVTIIALGIVLLVVYNKKTKSQKENTTFQAPYLKNVGIGFILFGLYYLTKYFTN